MRTNSSSRARPRTTRGTPRTSTRTSSQSPLAVARTAYRVAQRSLPPYGRPRAQRRYTQHQLFALLALRDYFGLDYRRTIELVREWKELQRALGLRSIPHYSTLCYAEHRLLEKGGPGPS
jgi:hypothetical protein